MFLLSFDNYLSIEIFIKKFAQGEWPCDFCTFFNKGESQNCEMCASPRETSSKAKKKQFPEIIEEQKRELAFLQTHNKEKTISKDTFSRDIYYQNNDLSFEKKKSKNTLPKLDENLNLNRKSEENRNSAGLKQDSVVIEQNYNFSLFSAPRKQENDNFPKDEKSKFDNKSDKKEPKSNNNFFEFDYFDFEPQKETKSSASPSKMIENVCEKLTEEKIPKILQTGEKWRKKLCFCDRVDFRSSPQSLGKGYWVPAVVVQMRMEPAGLALEVMFEGFVRFFIEKRLFLEYISEILSKIA